MERSGGNSDAITITLTSGCLRSSYLPLHGKLGFFPNDAIGGATPDDAGDPVTLQIPGVEEDVVTDINGPKARFRERGAFRRFFAETALKPGQQVRIERQSDRRYRLRLADGSASPEPGPVSMDELRSRFAEFRASQPEQVRLAIRRRRVRELRGLLASGDVPLEVFNREVWPFETTTRLDRRADIRTRIVREASRCRDARSPEGSDR